MLFRSGQVLLEIDEVDMAVLAAPRADGPIISRLFGLEWEPTKLEPTDAKLGALLVIGDPELLAGLPAETHRQVLGTGDIAALRDELARKDAAWDAIAVVCPPRSVDEALSDVEQLEVAKSRTLLVADIVRTVSQVGTRNSPRLWIVTRGAQQVEPSDGITLTQAELRGISRVLTFEHPELRPTTVDVDAEGSASADALVTELLAGAEHEIGRAHV